MAVRKATAKKTSAKKSAVKKAAAKKTLATKSPARKAVAKKTSAKKSAAKKSVAKKTVAKKSTVTKAAVKASKGATAKKSAPRKYLPRADRGAPADGFFERQPPELRGYLEALRALVKKAAPEARESMKWGMPYYEMKRGFCALYTSTTYAALNVMAPPEMLEDPDGRLEGKGKTMRHIKVRSPEDIDEESILRWVKTAAAYHS